MTEGDRESKMENGDRLDSHVKSVRLGIQNEWNRLGRPKIKRQEDEKISLVLIDQLRKKINQKTTIDIIVEPVGCLLVLSEARSIPLATFSVFAYKGEKYRAPLIRPEGENLEKLIDLLNEIEQSRKQFLELMYFNIFESQVVLSPPALREVESCKTRILGLG